MAFQGTSREMVAVYPLRESEQGENQKITFHTDVHTHTHTYTHAHTLHLFAPTPATVDCKAHGFSILSIVAL